MEIPRPAPPRSAPEREMLEAWLDFHRMTLERKCHGLSPAQLRRRAVPPSALSLLGLVRHMADVERNWFRRALAHEEAPPHYRSDQAPTGAFDQVDTARCGGGLCHLARGVDACPDRGRLVQRARRVRARCRASRTPVGALGAGAYD